MIINKFILNKLKSNLNKLTYAGSNRQIVCIVHKYSGEVIEVVREKVTHNIIKKIYYKTL